MAASMVFTHETVNGPVNKLIATWVSAAGGGVAGTTTFPINGFIVKGITNPDAGGTQPDDNYNIIVTDGNGINVLLFAQDDLLLRDETVTEETYFLLTAQGGASVVADLLTVTVDSAGGSNGGVCTLYYLKQASV